MITAFHASNAPNLQSFDLSKSKKADYGTGIYLASTEAGTYGYGSHLYKIELNLSNPYLVDNSEQSKEIGKIIAKKADVLDYIEPEQHPFLAVCDLLNMSDGPSAITKAVLKAGYDGLIISQEILRERGTKANTDYIIAFSEKQITKIEKMDSGNIKETLEKAIVNTLRGKYMEQRELWNSLIDQHILNSSSMEHSVILIETLKKLEDQGVVKKQHGLLSLA